MFQRGALLLVTLFWCSEGLSAQERAQLEFPARGGTVTLEADRLDRQAPDRVVAEGAVLVRYQETTLQTERLIYDPSRKKAVLEGPFQLRQGEQWLKAERGEWDLENNLGVLYEVEGFTDNELYVKARLLRKTGPDTFLAEDGFLTSCPEDLPKWSFLIDKARINRQSTTRFTHTLFRVKNIPVFYLPYVIFPSEKKKRSSGFMIPTTGNSSNKGRRISQSFYLVLGRSADLMLHEEYFSKRGFGHGLTFRTRPSPRSFLELDAFMIDDRLGQGGFAMTGQGEAHFGQGYRAVADFDLVTNFVFRQVFSDNFYTATRPDRTSRFFLTNNFGSRSFNFLVLREETIFPGRNILLRNTPHVGFKLTGQPLFGLPLYLDLRAAAEGVSRSDRLLETPTLVQRLDLFPELYFSVPLGQGLRATPRLALRDTFYSDSLEEQAGGETAVSPENLHRQYLEFSLDLKGWGLSKVYPSPSGGWKHLVEPTLRYRYLSGIDQFDRIIRFDQQDAVADTHEVEYALINRFFVKRRTGSGTINHEWLSVKVAQKYFFDPDFGGARVDGEVNQFFPLNTLTGFPYSVSGRRFSPVTTLARITPKPSYSFDLRGDYDAKFHRFRNFSVTGWMRQGSLLLGTTYFRTEQVEEGSFERNQLQGQVAWGDFRRGLSLSSLFSYNALERRFLNYKGRLNYFWDCCGVSVEYERFNLGIRQERQLRFSFFLKGLGAFGTIRRPDSIF